MPSIDENRSWNSYSWEEHGDEWSQDWGNAETQWHATILPRVRHFLPVKNILEIAPGHGRWTRFLLQQTESYVGVDLNALCVQACEERFKDSKGARFVTNDGRSLDAVHDGSIDFVFSFDSLVHVEMDVMDSYLRNIARKLSRNGVAFIHHSNLGEYGTTALRVSQWLWRPLHSNRLAQIILPRLQLAGWDNWRGASVSAASVAESSQSAGLKCIGQELVNWGRHNWRLVDCISIFTLPGSKWSRDNIVVRNPYFMAEARSSRAVSKVYPLRSESDPRSLSAIP